MVQIYSENQIGALISTTPIDPDSEIIANYIYKPPIWSADTVYIANKHIVIPTVFNGYYYVCTSGGKSAAVEPTFPTTANTTVVDNEVIWKSVDYSYFLQENETIIDSSWDASDAGITLVLDSFNASATKVKVTTIPSTIKKFTLTNHITFTDGTNTQKDDRSVTYLVLNK